MSRREGAAPEPFGAANTHADPQFRQHALVIHQAQGRAIEALLTGSLLKGELRTGRDIAALARSVQAITSGAGLLWALDRQGALVQRLRQELNNVLSPHFPPRHGHDLEESRFRSWWDAQALRLR